MALKTTALESTMEATYHESKVFFPNSKLGSTD